MKKKSDSDTYYGLGLGSSIAKGSLLSRKERLPSKGANTNGYDSSRVNEIHIGRIREGSLGGSEEEDKKQSQMKSLLQEINNSNKKKANKNKKINIEPQSDAEKKLLSIYTSSHISQAQKKKKNKKKDISKNDESPFSIRE